MSSASADHELTFVDSPAPTKHRDALFETQCVHARMCFVRLDVGGEMRICTLAAGG